MRGPKPAAIELSDAERQGLEALRRHSTPQQLALRAGIVLAAGRNNAQIARDLAVEVTTASGGGAGWGCKRSASPA